MERRLEEREEVLRGVGFERWWLFVVVREVRVEERIDRGKFLVLREVERIVRERGFRGRVVGRRLLNFRVGMDGGKGRVKE